MNQILEFLEPEKLFEAKLTSSIVFQLVIGTFSTNYSAVKPVYRGEKVIRFSDFNCYWLQIAFL